MVNSCEWYLEAEDWRRLFRAVELSPCSLSLPKRLAPPSQSQSLAIVCCRARQSQVLPPGRCAPASSVLSALPSSKWWLAAGVTVWPGSDGVGERVSPAVHTIALAAAWCHGCEQDRAQTTPPPRPRLSGRRLALSAPWATDCLRQRPVGCTNLPNGWVWTVHLHFEFILWRFAFVFVLTKINQDPDQPIRATLIDTVGCASSALAGAARPCGELLCDLGVVFTREAGDGLHQSSTKSIVQCNSLPKSPATRTN